MPQAPPNALSGSSGIIFGAGNPNGVVKSLPNTIYYDTANFVYYATTDGTTWIVGASGGGGGGTTQVYTGIGSPTGVVVPAGAAAIYFDKTIPSQPIVWYWNSATWTQFIG